jgi:hypothetical protein
MGKKVWREVGKRITKGRGRKEVGSKVRERGIQRWHIVGREKRCLHCILSLMCSAYSSLDPNKLYTQTFSKYCDSCASVHCVKFWDSSFELADCNSADLISSLRGGGGSFRVPTSFLANPPAPFPFPFHFSSPFHSNLTSPILSHFPFFFLAHVPSRKAAEMGRGEGI